MKARMFHRWRSAYKLGPWFLSLFSVSVLFVSTSKFKFLLLHWHAICLFMRGPWTPASISTYGSWLEVLLTPGSLSKGPSDSFHFQCIEDIWLLYLYEFDFCTTLLTLLRWIMSSLNLFGNSLISLFRMWFCW